ncbi:MAG: hypothetical protein AB1499_16495 [Nitrospirota bacterium]
MIRAKKTFYFLLLVCLILNYSSVFAEGGPDALPGNAPPESPAPASFYDRGLPPEGWKSGTLWIIAVHDTRKGGDSYLEIDWARFYCMVNGQPVVMSGEISDNKTGIYWSGSWPKTPWCQGTEERSDMMIDFTGETALLPLHEWPDRVWHFGSKRIIVPDDASRCYSEARIRLSGNALVQLGADFWIDDKSEWCPDHKCNISGFGSDWIGATDEWVVIGAGRR